MYKRSRQYRSTRKHRGITAVEVSLTLPILLLIFFAQLEFSRANMIWHAVHNAAYEGARRGIVPGASAKDVREAADEVLSAVSVINTTTRVSPAIISPDTESVTVTVSVPVDQNSWVFPKFFQSKSIRATMTLQRERVDEYGSL